MTHLKWDAPKNKFVRVRFHYGIRPIATFPKQMGTQWSQDIENIMATSSFLKLPIESR